MKPLYLFTAALFFFFSSFGGPTREFEQGLFFVENKGQIVDQFGHYRSDIKYALHSKGLDIFVSERGLHYQFCRSVGKDSVETYRVDMILEGASRPSEIIAEQLPANINYKAANTEKMVVAQTAGRIRYKEVYPGIDWVLYVRDGKLEYDLIVEEGADVSLVRQRYLGATGLDINGTGGLDINTPFGQISEQKPLSYGEGGRKVGSRFVLSGDRIGFELEEHDGRVTIDPVIKWATYYGGAGSDFLNQVATDNAGNVYVCGSTNSTANIATTGIYQQSFAGGIADGFVARFNEAGVRQWATYYGGAGYDSFSGIACDNNGFVFVSGYTESSGLNVGTVHQAMLIGPSDGILLKLNEDGSVIFCTYYGGPEDEEAMDVKCDANNNVFISGSTRSDSLIATTGTHQDSLYGDLEAYLVKFDNDGVRQWGTYFGGPGYDNNWRMSIDPAGYIYLSGTTGSTDRISTNGAFQTVYQGGSRDGYVAKFRNDNGQVSWSSYIGDAGLEAMCGIACGPADEVYVGGGTSFFTQLHTTGAYQTSGNGDYDGLLLKFDSTGQRLWGTYYGGAMFDEIRDLACNSFGDVWVKGWTTSSNGNNYIATNDAYQQNFGGGSDDFLVKFNSNGQRLWGTYFGGPDQENSLGLYCYGTAVYATGVAESASGISTVGSHQSVSGGFQDGFLAKFDECMIPQIAAIGDTVFCEGDSVLLSAPTDILYSYQWLQNGVLIPNVHDSDLYVSTAGNYSLEVSSLFCGTDTSQQMAIVVHPLPAPLITASGNVLSTTVAYTSYQWYENGNLIPGANAQNYTATNNQSVYTVVVTDGNGCEGSSATFSLTLGEVSRTGNSISVHPNPNNGIFILSGRMNMASGVVRYSITDLSGRLISEGGIEVKNGYVEEAISLPAHTTPGYYLLKTIAGEQPITMPVVKQ